VAGAKPSGQGRLWLIAGTDPMAYNDPDQPPVVEIREGRARHFADKLTLPAMSVSLYALGVH